jgi:hypothetical protein
MLGGCGVAAVVSQSADQVQIGFTRDQVVDIMGNPQVSITNPTNTGITYSHYCTYGLILGTNDGFFFYKDRVYRKIQRIDETSTSLHGVYDLSRRDYRERYQRDPPFNCTARVRVNWARSPTTPEMLADRQAILDAQRARRESLRAREAQIVSQDYFIDGLVITHTQDRGADCVNGGDYRIEVKGSIGPDSSFALEELLKRSPNCLQENREIKSRTTVQLDSLGGLLKDCYLMGRTFRTHEVKTIITSSSVCASSCAVAYLGGVNRLMENDSIIMFHSPYLPDLNAIGERIADCDIGSEMTAQLLEYYQEMTSPEQGERLMNRTMSYCSAEDGWVLRGSAAAELFGVATQI